MWIILDTQVKTALWSTTTSMELHVSPRDNRPLHKWRLNLNNNTHTSFASHSCENSFVLKHECKVKDVPRIIKIQAPSLQRVYGSFPSEGGGELHYKGYIGMCSTTGCGLLAVLIRNRVSILAILVSNREWFLHSS